MNQLKIDAPCPIVIKRLEKDGNDFSCKTCNKNVVDFRGKSSEEIKSILQHGMCGIYHRSQLPAQVKMTRARQFLFHGLTFLSFLGFNVSPINAQSNSEIKKLSFNQTSGTITNSQAKNGDDEKLSKGQKRRKYRKARRERKKNNRNREVIMGAYG